MSKMDKKDQVKKIEILESENHALSQELDLNKAQVTQYKTMCESQKQALKDKDELLQQLRDLNESLQADIKSLREMQKTPPPKSSDKLSYSGIPKNPWLDGSSGEVELEQYRKLFVGGLNYDTTEATLRKFYEQYGEVQSAVIALDHDNRSRGFGFVIFTAAEMVDTAQKGRPHVIDGRTVDSKRALSKEDTDKPENAVRTQKLFVGGMRRDTEESDLYEYFSRFGNVDKIEIMTYKDTGKRRGFAFVFFDDYDPVDKMIMIKHHVICGQRCEVKKAVPRDQEEKIRNKRQQQSQGKNSSGSGSGSGGQYYDNMSGGGNDYNNYNMQGRGGGQQQQQQYQMGGMGMGGMGNNQNMGGNMGGNMGSNQMGGMGMNPPQMGNNQQGYNPNQQQQQQGSGSGDLPPEAQALWASYMSFMQSQQQGNAGPMRNQNTHSNRSAPYNTNLVQPQQQPQQPPPPQAQQYNTYNSNPSNTATS